MTLCRISQIRCTYVSIIKGRGHVLMSEIYTRIYTGRDLSNYDARDRACNDNIQRIRTVYYYDYVQRELYSYNGPSCYNAASSGWTKSGILGIPAVLTIFTGLTNPTRTTRGSSTSCRAMHPWQNARFVTSLRATLSSLPRRAQPSVLTYTPVATNTSRPTTSRSINASCTFARRVVVFSTLFPRLRIERHFLSEQNRSSGYYLYRYLVVRWFPSRRVSGRVKIARSPHRDSSKRETPWFSSGWILSGSLINFLYWEPRRSLGLVARARFRTFIDQSHLLSIYWSKCSRQKGLRI